jgi:hypothetical protein
MIHNIYQPLSSSTIAAAPRMGFCHVCLQNEPTRLLWYAVIVLSQKNSALLRSRPRPEHCSKKHA